MRISFVIPVYKVGDYLHQCVKSIIQQTYKDIEVILVDDGSPDNCPQICDELASKDGRIKVIHKNNGGLSDTRNSGLRLACGEYVVFIDGDDFWIGEDSLQKLVDILENHQGIDFINFNCCYCYPEKGYKKWVEYNEALCVPVTSDTAIRQLVTSGTFPMSACFKVLSTKLLRDNELYFKVGILCEDIPWFIDLLDCAQIILFVNDYIYAYRQNVSTSISRNFGVKSFDSIISIISDELGKLNTRHFSEESKDCIKSFLAYEFCICLGSIHFLNKKERNERYEKLMSYKWLLRYKQNPKVRKASLINSLFGIKALEYILCYYMNRRYHN